MKRNNTPIFLILTISGLVLAASLGWDRAGSRKGRAAGRGSSSSPAPGCSTTS